VKDSEGGDVLLAVDAAVADRVLVFGSLPPAGRDLDLLVRPEEAAALATALEGAEFRRSGRTWARFRGCSVSVVELIPAGALRLPVNELDAVFADGSPLPGALRVVEPAPHHALLILARRLEHERRLPAKHRKRIDRVLELDPGAWASASRRAAAWRAEAALPRLRALHSSDEAHPAFSWRALLPRPRRTRVIALSGLDVERRRRHAAALAEALDRLGFDATIEQPLRVDSVRTPEHTEPSGLRRAAVATRVAVALWRPIWHRLGRGGIVIFDGSAVDAAAALRLDRNSRMTSLPLRLTPGAVRSFVLEEDGHDDPSRCRARAYAAAARLLPARSLPPELGRDETCAAIAEEVFTALTGRSRIRRLYAAIRRRHGW
jgi:hypothetical protein